LRHLALLTKYKPRYARRDTHDETMKAIILCAGYGTQVSPLTKDTPKPLLSVRGKPIIEYIVNKISSLEKVDEIIVVTNQKFLLKFRQWLLDFHSRIPVKIVSDGSLSNKDRFGAIRDLDFIVKKENLNDDLLVVGGDNLFNFELDVFIKSSSDRKSDASIGIYDLNGRTRANKYGIVYLDKESKVTNFDEKPSRLNGSRLVSLCLYFLPKDTLSLIGSYLSTNNDSDSIGNYIKWLAKNYNVYGFNFDGDWFDIGDIDSYTEAVCSF